MTDVATSCWIGNFGMEYLDLFAWPKVFNAVKTLSFKPSIKASDVTDWFNLFTALCQEGKLKSFEVILLLITCLPEAKLFIFGRLRKICFGMGWTTDNLLTIELSALKVLLLDHVEMFLKYNHLQKRAFLSLIPEQ